MEIAMPQLHPRRSGWFDLIPSRSTFEHSVPIILQFFMIPSRSLEFKTHSEPLSPHVGSTSLSLNPLILFCLILFLWSKEAPHENLSSAPSASRMFLLKEQSKMLAYKLNRSLL